MLIARSEVEILCSSCGKRVVIPGYHLCYKCTPWKLRRGSAKLTRLGLCTQCGRPRKDGAKYCQRCSDISAARHERWRRAVYRQILDAYGNKCACCGEDNIGFLTLDHKNNDGAKHRRETGQKGGYIFYKMIIKNGFPDDLQLLCYNCNNGKQRFGACPHTKEGIDEVRKRYRRKRPRLEV